MIKNHDININKLETLVIDYFRENQFKVKMDNNTTKYVSN